MYWCIKLDSRNMGSCNYYVPEREQNDLTSHRLWKMVLGRGSLSFEDGYVALFPSTVPCLNFSFVRSDSNSETSFSSCFASRFWGSELVKNGGVDGFTSWLMIIMMLLLLLLVVVVVEYKSVGNQQICISPLTGMFRHFQRGISLLDYLCLLLFSYPWWAVSYQKWRQPRARLQLEGNKGMSISHDQPKNIKESWNHKVLSCFCLHCLVYYMLGRDLQHCEPCG